MVAPVQPTPINGIADYDSVSFEAKNGETVVTMKKREGGKDYWVTLTFYKPIDEGTIRDYLAAKEAKDKIEQMIKQYGVFETVYGGKKDFRLESAGNELYLNYVGKKGALNRLKMSESDFEITFYQMLESYQKKIDAANKAKKQDREKKFRDKKKAINDLKEKFLPFSKIRATPAQPDPRPAGPAINVGAAQQPVAQAAGQGPGQQLAGGPPLAVPPAQQAAGGPPPVGHQVPAAPAGQQVQAAQAPPANA